MKMSEVQGFNYSGSWGTSALDLWQHHDRELMRVEVGRGATYFPGWNTARWWLSHESFLRDPARFLADFEDGLGVFASHGIVVMPVLFNRWRTPECDFGGVSIENIVPGFTSTCAPGDFESLESPKRPRSTQALFRWYLDSVVGAHVDDPRILAWDLCNEPLGSFDIAGPESHVVTSELRWLRWTADVCRHLGATQPITIGMAPGIGIIEVTEPIVDIISFHPYFVPMDPASWGMGPDLEKESPIFSKPGFEGFLDWAVDLAARTGKELVASETVWGSNSDAERAEIADYTLAQLSKRRIGFIVHALHHSLVADLHSAEHGPVGVPGHMEFISADGSIRPGHEVYNTYASPRDSGG